MALVTSRTQLSQGNVTEVSDMAFTTGVGADIGIDSAGNEMPALAVGEMFEVRNHSNSQNNGLYTIVTVNTSTTSYEADKISGALPVVASAEAATMLGSTGTLKSIFFDTAALEAYILEQGNVDAAGVTGQAIYSFMMQEWKDDDFLISNASFPMLAIDTDAGKFIIGQNAAGEDTGWNWKDIVKAGETIRTRKLVRAMGWDEVDSAGVTTGRYFNATTLGTFEDPVNDFAFYQFGSDTAVDDTVDFDFGGPVDEAVRFFERQVDNSINGGTGIAISADGRTLTRADGGNWRTDGYKVGGQITLRDSEDAQSDGTWLLSIVGSGVDGVVTGGRAADSAAGINFVDGAGGDDSLVLPAGETTWAEYGFVVGSNIIITAAEDVGNDGTHIITSFSSDFLTAFVVTASFTANADDTTAVIGMFDDALTPDITVNGAINNDNAVRLGLRVRDGDTNGKTFGEATLASAGRTVLGNFVFAFPLANATDLKIAATDATIEGSGPYTGMTIGFFATPQVKAGLVGGSFNFGIVITGNDGTAQEVFEFVQHELRELTDIDTEGTVIGRSIGLLARFVGDSLEMGSGDGGLTFPTNPGGGGSGVFIDGLNAVSNNDVSFFDNTGTSRKFPETIAVTLDFNATAIGDALTEFDLFYDRTIRTPLATLTDLVIVAAVAATGTLTFSANASDGDQFVIDEKTYTFETSLTDVDGNILIGALATDSIDNAVAAITLAAGAGSTYALSTTLHPTVTAVNGGGDTMDATAKEPGPNGNTLDTTDDNAQMAWGGATLSGGLDATFTSAGADLPNNADIAVNAYVRVGGLVTGAAMNGTYQITVETTPGSDWDVIRYDGKTIVAVAAEAADIDQHPVDTPDGVIVHTNVGLTATTISFTSPDTMSDSGNGLAIFAIGDVIEIEGTASNDSILEVLTVAAGVITFVEQTVTTESAGASMTVTKIASGLADADFVFNYDFDNNVQGGRTGGDSTFLVGKAIGFASSQYIASPVANLVSGTPLTIPLFAQTERNTA